ncbi:MAG: hypothetical protein K2R98_22025 [Gemmataceae bacterium]|nr:hypothetical protein [Gemmataceae bacterium]
MSIEGTVVNGVVVLDSGTQLPEGVRVRVELTDSDDPDDFAPPPEPYDREKELAILREAIEDVRAGRGMPLEEFMAKLSAELNLPSVPPE